MHWRQEFPTRGHAIRAASNLRALSVRQRHALPYALHGYDDELGSLKSILKKVTKVAAKISPSHIVAKKLKIDKFSPSHILLSASSKKSPPKAITPANPPPQAQDVQPTAPVIPQVPDYTAPSYFGPSGGGGGGASFAPVPATDASEGGLSMPVIMALSAAGLIVVYLLARGRK